MAEIPGFGIDPKIAISSNKYATGLD